jgi:hypothetical protein
MNAPDQPRHNLPSNVAKFEELMYLSVAIGVVVSALLWEQSTALPRPFGSTGFVLFVQALALVFLVLLIWLIARRQKNWARWLFLIVGILDVPFYFVELPTVLRLHMFAGFLSVVQAAAQALATVLVFTGNARGWFKQSPQLVGRFDFRGRPPHAS